LTDLQKSPTADFDNSAPKSPTGERDIRKQAKEPYGESRYPQKSRVHERALFTKEPCPQKSPEADIDTSTKEPDGRFRHICKRVLQQI